ncbi:MAG: hypothetical protein GY705_23990 [Bacteroidetes bacterium]|nr:hypothetical protein [Bacteroidota bacterium]
MEVNMSGLAAREVSLNKRNTEQEILQKTLAKTQEVQKQQEVDEPRPVEQTGTQKQGRIDLYA